MAVDFAGLCSGKGIPAALEDGGTEGMGGCADPAITAAFQHGAGSGSLSLLLWNIGTIVSSTLCTFKWGLHLFLPCVFL